MTFYNVYTSTDLPDYSQAGLSNLFIAKKKYDYYEKNINNNFDDKLSLIYSWL